MLTKIILFNLVSFFFMFLFIFGRQMLLFCSQFLFPNNQAIQFQNHCVKNSNNNNDIDDINNSDHYNNNINGDDDDDKYRVGDNSNSY